MWNICPTIYYLVAVNNAIVGKMYLSIKTDSDNSQYLVWNTEIRSALLFSNKFHAKRMLNCYGVDSKVVEFVTYEPQQQEDADGTRP